MAGEQLELDIDPSGVTEINRRLLIMLETLMLDKNLFNGRLWSFDDIASYTGVSTMTARRMMKMEGSPNPIFIPTGNTSKLARYHPDQVVRFLSSR